MPWDVLFSSCRNCIRFTFFQKCKIEEKCTLRFYLFVTKTGRQSESKMTGVKLKTEDASLILDVTFWVREAMMVYYALPYLGSLPPILCQSPRFLPSAQPVVTLTGTRFQIDDKQKFQQRCMWAVGMQGWFKHVCFTWDLISPHKHPLRSISSRPSHMSKLSFNKRRVTCPRSYSSLEHIDL